MDHRSLIPGELYLVNSSINGTSKLYFIGKTKFGMLIFEDFHGNRKEYSSSSQTVSFTHLGYERRVFEGNYHLNQCSNGELILSQSISNKAIPVDKSGFLITVMEDYNFSIQITEKYPLGKQDIHTEYQ